MHYNSCSKDAYKLTITLPLRFVWHTTPSQEVVSHYTNSLEKHGLQRLFRLSSVQSTAESSASLGTIPWRSVIMAAPASAVGFLAFEYGRTIAGITTASQSNKGNGSSSDSA
jgi:hypothetical protein